MFQHLLTSPPLQGLYLAKALSGRVFFSEFVELEEQLSTPPWIETCLCPGFYIQVATFVLILFSWLFLGKCTHSEVGFERWCLARDRYRAWTADQAVVSQEMLH